MSGGISGRDLKLFLDAAKEALRNPAAIDEMLRLIERNERAIEVFRLEQGELQLAKEEHARHLARTSKEANEQIARARNQWAAEEAHRRLQLEADEYEIARRKERVERNEKRLLRLDVHDPVATGQQAEQQSLGRLAMSFDLLCAGCSMLAVRCGRNTGACSARLTRARTTVLRLWRWPSLSKRGSRTHKRRRSKREPRQRPRRPRRAPWSASYAVR